MLQWKLRFEPPPGDRKSPSDYIEGLDHPKDKAIIYEHLKMLRNLEPKDWSIKPIKRRNLKIYQLTAGNFRIYLDYADDTIVVFHVYSAKTGAWRTVKPE